MDYVFVDTNILIYTLSEDEPEKRLTANKILLKNNCLISTQVINELSNVLYKKFNLGYQEVLNLIDEISKFTEVVSFSLITIKKAHFIKYKYKYSYYDSLIIATALENNCKILYSEDMHNKQIIENKLLILNPFVE